MLTVMNAENTVRKGGEDSPETRTDLARRAGEFVRSADFIDRLSRRVARRTESQAPGGGPAALAYLSEELVPELDELDFVSTIHDNPESDEHPLLITKRVEDPKLPTVLLYGHADVQFAHDSQWAGGLDPWVLTRDGDRLYGRGTADNKGQHSVNTAALKTVLDGLRAEHGTGEARLGYNITILIETAEEAGSKGLRSFAAAHADDL